MSRTVIAAPSSPRSLSLSPSAARGVLRFFPHPALTDVAAKSRTRTYAYVGRHGNGCAVARSLLRGRSLVAYNFSPPYFRASVQLDFRLFTLAVRPALRPPLQGTKRRRVPRPQLSKSRGRSKGRRRRHYLKIKRANPTAAPTLGL